MHAGKLIFAQLMEFAPWHTFRCLVSKYRGDFNVRTFSCRWPSATRTRQQIPKSA
jgi:hypothetical protein